jgi:SAM-dependent methyltransferase
MAEDPYSHHKLPSYYARYCQIAADLGPAAKVLELGVAYGTSLELWQHLFPQGEVTGVDIDSAATWPPGTRRIVMGQTDLALPATLNDTFDLIVDDACHTGDSTARSFDQLWSLLNPGGYYVVEDWQMDFTPGFWGTAWNRGLVQAVQAFLTALLAHEESPVDFIEYRWGLCIIHRRRL